MKKQVKFPNALRTATLSAGLFLSASAFAQQVVVKGNVVDETGEPVIGASVKVVGGTLGTVTDIDGNFTLNADKKSTIEVTYIGYEPVKMQAGQNLTIHLKNTSSTLNEVVVIGYGAVKKSDLTGSVTALKPDSKNKGLVVNAQDMLSGKVAGVNVTSNSGEPGVGTQIRIRGGSSLNASNDPLIVIDGVPMDNNKVGITMGNSASNLLSTINPQDIESFNVLKDASATAIYGSRGSNGVIIITTKKGHKGQKPEISYSGSVSLSMKKKTQDVMDGDQYRAYIKSLFNENDDAVKALGTANTDWQDLIYRKAVSHDHNVTVSGSVKDYLPYRVSLGYTGQQGILKNSDYNRYTASVNLNPSLLNNTSTSTSTPRACSLRRRRPKRLPSAMPFRSTRHRARTLSHRSTTSLCSALTHSRLCRTSAATSTGSPTQADLATRHGRSHASRMLLPTRSLCSNSATSRRR